MKYSLIGVFLLSSMLGIYAQEANTGNFVPEYVEDLYRFSDNNALSGTARYRAMSGAMGALGGDLSATKINPAGSAVFLGNDAALTLGVTMDKNTVNFGGTSNAENNTNFNLTQGGAVLVFDDLNSEDWKNISIGINYEKKTVVDENLVMSPNSSLVDTGGNSFGGYKSQAIGDADELNFTVGANLRDKVYFGLGFNFQGMNKETSEVYFENNLDGNTYSYNKDYTPSYKEANGLSISAGAIFRPSQQVRLGLAYESPTWYNDAIEDLLLFEMRESTSGEGTNYYIDGFREAYYYDYNSAHRVTGSAAVVFGGNGLLSADVTYKDYNTSKYKPENKFTGENAFLSNMESSLAVRLGAEFRIKDLRLRGGYRMESSPFEEISLDLGNNTASYQPYGDLTGFSVGAGYEFNDFYLDASYDYFSRDRNYIMYGNHYDFGASVSADDFTQEEALDALSLNLQDQGLSTVVDDIKQKQGTVSLTVGFRF